MSSKTNLFFWLVIGVLIVPASAQDTKEQDPQGTQAVQEEKAEQKEGESGEQEEAESGESLALRNRKEIEAISKEKTRLRL